MDDNERRRLQRLYDAASTSSAAAAGTTDAPGSSQVNDIVSLQRHQQNLLQQEIANARVAGGQQSDEQLMWLLRNNRAQQIHELSNYGQSTLGSISAMRNARVLQQSIDQMVDANTAAAAPQPAPPPTDTSISLLMRNIQQPQNNDSDRAVQSQQYHDVLRDAVAAAARGDVGTIDIRSLLNDTSGFSYFDTQRQFNSLSHPQHATMYQNRLSSQNIPLLSETDLLLSRARTNLSQHQAPSSSYGSTGINVADPDLTHQLLVDEYLRAQQNEIRAVNQAYQSQQLLESYGGQSRLAFLMQQRQELERQSAAAASAASVSLPRNISLQNDEVAEKEDAEVTKIGKMEAYIEKPKRPLSAYNIFFRQERQRLLGGNDDDAQEGKSEELKGGDGDDDKKPAAAVEVHGSKKRKRGKPHHKVTFEQMAKIIGQRWKELESDESKKKYYQDIALKDKERYQAEIAAWKQQRYALSSKYRKKNETP